VTNLLDPTHLARDFGYLGILLIVFLESGVVFGFFLPGDSLLFTAGLLAAQGHLNLTGLMVVSVLGAIAGNNAGYYTGRLLGDNLFGRRDSVWFNRRRIAEAHRFFGRFGGKALVLARFIPAVRTFVPIIAGVARMPYRQFWRFNALGGLLWGIGLPALGYSLGRSVPSIDKYLLPVIALIVILSALPVILSYRRGRRARK